MERVVPGVIILVLYPSIMPSDVNENTNDQYVLSSDEYAVDVSEDSDDFNEYIAYGGIKRENRPDPLKDLTEKEGKGEPHVAFLLKLEGCSAVLIAKDWAMSATHCMETFNFERSKDSEGNLVLVQSNLYVTQFGGSKEKPSWTAPLEKVKPSSSKDSYGWRKVEMMYIQNYHGQSRIYQGNDILLAKLAPEWGESPENYIAPVCLPDPKKPDLKSDLSDQLYYIGLGRRRIPHCVTNSLGPDKYYPCGRPVFCSKEHKTDICGVDFIYEGKEIKKCLKQKLTPSSKNKVCVELLKQTEKEDFKCETFVFKPDGELMTTCYPFKVKKGSKGWCATRVPWIDENQEPQVDSGWGFCGNDDLQKSCTDQIDTSLRNIRKNPVARLSNEFCLEQLEINVKTEQPETPAEMYNDLEKSRLICIGRNHTVSENKVPAYTFNPKSKEFTKIDLGSRLSSLKAANRSLTAIDGGACFGDSGGPLIKYEGKTPVVVGIMSFLLWGICKSKFDPSYYARVQANYDFILKFVPKDEVCFA